jgi:hypothetical protein
MPMEAQLCVGEDVEGVCDRAPRTATLVADSQTINWRTGAAIGTAMAISLSQLRRYPCREADPTHMASALLDGKHRSGTKGRIAER